MKNLLILALAAAFLANPVLAGKSLPDQASDTAHEVVYLGEAKDVSGKVVEGYAIIHYKKGYGKPPWAGGGKGNGGSEDPAASCYGFLAKGAKWKTTEPYVVASDMDAALVAKDLETWDNQVAFDIFSNQDLTSVADGVDTVSPDDKNEVMWGDVPYENAIAITIIWGVFSGNPSWRYLAEWDVVFDNVDYDWSYTGEAGKMDFENIATHEFGHAAGLADLYETSCAEQTMYGYADYGETKKQTLEVGDIAGIKELYK